MADRDDKIRDLVHRLVEMSPEAPPFPEGTMVQLDSRPEQKPNPTSPRARWAWAVAGAMAVLVLIGVPAYLLGARSDEGEVVDDPVTTVAPPTTTAPATTVPVEPTTPPTTELPAPPPVADTPTTVYLLADLPTSNRPGPLLVAVHRDVAGGDLIGATLRALLEGAGDEAEFSTAIPSGSELLGYELDGRTLRVDLTAEFESGGGSASMFSRLAQLVFTATRFGEVDDVVVLIDGDEAEVFSAEGIVLDGPQSRADYYEQLPLILIENPPAGATTTAPFLVSGLSNTFEASLAYEVRVADGGRVVAEGFTTATCGSGCVGEFEFLVGAAFDEPTRLIVKAWEFSAEDGSERNVIEYEVDVVPGEGIAEGMWVTASAVPGAPPVVDRGYVTEPELRLLVAAAEGSSISATATHEDGSVAAGSIVPSAFEGFTEVSLVLEPGVNVIALAAERAGAVASSPLTVTLIPDAETTIGFIEGGEFDSRNPESTLFRVDYAQWLVGDEANAAAIEDGFIAEGETVPNDYYIRNENPQLRDLPVDITNYQLYLLNEALNPVPESILTWLQLFENGDTFSNFGATSEFTPYWFVVNADDEIVQMVQQYVP